MYLLGIVDDEPAIRRGLSLIPWHSAGFEVAGLFPDGRDVIAYLEKNMLDAVLTDIRMTHISGIELAKWLKENRPDIMVVLLSGYSEFHYAQEAIRYNTLRYLLKPTNPDELLEVFGEIRSALDKHKQFMRIERAISAIDEGDAVHGEDHLIKETLADTSDLNHIVKMIEDILASNENLSMNQNEMAARLNISPSYLSRLFHQNTGETYSAYMIRRRISYAKELLAISNTKVQDIGRIVGYYDVRHFIRVFNNYVGMSPNTYRRTVNKRTI